MGHVRHRAPVAFAMSMTLAAGGATTPAAAAYLSLGGSLIYYEQSGPANAATIVLFHDRLLDSATRDRGRGPAAARSPVPRGAICPARDGTIRPAAWGIHPDRGLAVVARQPGHRVRDPGGFLLRLRAGHRLRDPTSGSRRSARACRPG